MRRSTAIVALLAIIGAGDAAAQALFKCTTEGGRVSLAEGRCPPLLKQEPLPPETAQLHPPLHRLCTPATRKEIRVDANCRLMLSCLLEDPSNCGVYCNDRYQEYFPEVPMGPTSPLCLKLAGRSRGANWVQASPPQLIGDGKQESWSVYCVDARGAVFRGGERLYCLPGTARCARQIHELAAKAQTPDEVASSMCREKYGSQVAPHAPKPRPVPLSQARHTGMMIGAGAAATVVAAIAFVLWRRRRQT
jgi:hypothetical protein